MEQVRVQRFHSDKVCMLVGFTAAYLSILRKPSNASGSDISIRSVIVTHKSIAHSAILSVEKSCVLCVLSRCHWWSFSSFLQQVSLSANVQAGFWLYQCSINKLSSCLHHELLSQTPITNNFKPSLLCERLFTYLRLCFQLTGGNSPGNLI